MSCSRVLRLTLSLAVLALASCGASSTSYDVTGVVRFRHAPVAGARVGLAGQSQVTLATGSFRFSGVPGGPQVLDVQYAPDAGEVFVGERRIVDASRGESQEVQLPEPVALQASDVTTAGAHLSWSPFSGAGFREYKVYVGWSRGLDETTGKLVSVSTRALETEANVAFTNPWDGYHPDVEVFYRVFVMDETGKLAGSNIVSIVIPRYDRVLPRYQLTLASVHALSGPAVGVTWDGSHFWFMYQYDADGGYYTPKRSRLVEWDSDTGTELRSFSYEDEYARACGLAWTGSEFWASYYDHDVRSLDPGTGAVLKTWQQGAVDLDWDGAHLILGDQGELRLLDPVTGAVVATYVPPHPEDRYVGVAHRPGELWVASMWGPDIVILDDAGTVIGLAQGALTRGAFSSLVFRGAQLAVLFGSQLYLYDIQPPSPP